MCGGQVTLLHVQAQLFFWNQGDRSASLIHVFIGTFSEHSWSEIVRIHKTVHSKYFKWLLSFTLRTQIGVSWHVTLLPHSPNQGVSSWAELQKTIQYLKAL